MHWNPGHLKDEACVIWTPPVACKLDWEINIILDSLIMYL